MNKIQSEILKRLEKINPFFGRIVELIKYSKHGITIGLMVE